MPEDIKGRKVFSLLEVAQSIQKTIALRYQSSYWIRAEMNKLNFYNHSGHCYPDLVEKKDGRVIAQMRCVLWGDDYRRINENFLRVLKEPLRDGIKILFSATIGYHPQYGLSLQILDIDPGFTLGDLEREKLETVERLRREGIFDRNKGLDLPLIPQRIAVISVETSKGYADFLKVFEGARGSWGYMFFHMLFPSLLQGDKAVRAITGQLRAIRKVAGHFDVVAIVRGGGGDIGLSCYNHYELAREIALFPLPVITGIGHSTNETVAEMIAFENAITPTKLAEFLVQRFHDFRVPVEKAEERITDRSKRLLADEKARFGSEVKLFRSVTGNILAGSRHDLRLQVQALSRQSRFCLAGVKERLAAAGEVLKRGTYAFCSAEKQKIMQSGISLKKDAAAQLRHASLTLQNMEKNLANMSPENVMKRGYSITLLDGKAVRSADEVKEGQALHTLLYQGSIRSIIKSTTKPNDNE